MFIKLQNYKKIIFPVMLLGLLFFTFSFFYNKEEAISAVEQWDWECQEEEIGSFGQYLGGGEIPIGEAMDGTYAMAKEIIRNYDLMLPVGGQVVAAANAVYELPLPDECKAENCNTDCWMSYERIYWGECEDVTVVETACATGSCPGETCDVECDDVTKITTVCGPVCPPGKTCVSIGGEFCWGEKEVGDFCSCGPTCPPGEPFCYEVVPDTWCWGDSECKSVFDGGACQEVCTPPADAFCLWLGADCCCSTSTLEDACVCEQTDVCPPGEPFCFDVGDELKCWGDNECFDKSIGGACEEKYNEEFDCGISSCTGNACPIDAIVELGDQRAIIYIGSLHIANYAAAINTEIQKAPGLRAMLEKARIGMAACATPASGYEPTEEVQLVETLVSCDEAKWLRMLSDDQEECYLTNFFCCEPIEK